MKTNLSICISAVASNQGKTILTTALLYYFKKSVRPYKIGPDFIDPQFHKKVSKTNSINLDSFIMNEDQVRWIYQKYNNKKVSILEGVMGFYDGQNKGCSAYSITKLLNIPTILVLDASGSYITISAVLEGLKNYKKDNTIKAVVLNKISSPAHYTLIKDQIAQDHKDIIVLGWIGKNLPSLSNTHLGLDLNDKNKIKQISKDVLNNIDLELLKNTFKIRDKTDQKCNYQFEKIDKINKTLCIVNDKNFSFLYYDNLKYLKEIFKKVIIIKSTKDQPIPKDVNSIYICGGYVEDDKSYKKIKNSKKFRNSLIAHGKKGTKIYAECAGLLYLGKNVDNKKMTGLLDIDFTLEKRFNRLGYYYNSSGVKGHCFHYTKPTSLKLSHDTLSKLPNGKGIYGSWKNKNIFGTYLHTMFRNNPDILINYLK
jgi:cobyrinic acid a,c-diamide synthase